MNDETYMEGALQLAEKGAGLTSPGVMVGAIIVKDGSIVGEGFYTYDGVRHAEIIALEEAGAAACGSTVYVSFGTLLSPWPHRTMRSGLDRSRCRTRRRRNGGSESGSQWSRASHAAERGHLCRVWNSSSNKRAD